MSVTLGPVHPCPECGCLIQSASRSLGRESIEDATTGQRHRCQRPPRRPPPTLHECPACEKSDVFEYDGELYQGWGITLPMQRWVRHECGKAPASTPIPAPVKVEMAETGPRKRRNYDG